MMFGHEHHHEPSAIHAPHGPTPLWCKVAFVASVLAILIVAGHTAIWRLW